MVTHLNAGCVRRLLLIDIPKKPMLTLKGLQGDTAQVRESVFRKTVSCALHKSGFYGGVLRQKKKKHCHGTQLKRGGLVRWEESWTFSVWCSQHWKTNMSRWAHEPSTALWWWQSDAVGMLQNKTTRFILLHSYVLIFGVVCHKIPPRHTNLCCDWPIGEKKRLRGVNTLEHTVELPKQCKSK